MARQPDYNVYLSDKHVPEGREKRRYYKIGAAWKNRSGRGLMISLHPGVVIDRELLEDFSLGMFENDGNYERRSNHNPTTDGDFDDFGDDDIPF